MWKDSHTCWRRHRCCPREDNFSTRLPPSPETHTRPLAASPSLSCDLETKQSDSHDGKPFQRAHVKSLESLPANPQLSCVWRGGSAFMVESRNLEDLADFSKHDSSRAGKWKKTWFVRMFPVTLQQLRGCLEKVQEAIAWVNHLLFQWSSFRTVPDSPLTTKKLDEGKKRDACPLTLIFFLPMILRQPSSWISPMSPVQNHRWPFPSTVKSSCFLPSLL